MTGETYKLTAHESVTVRASTPEAFEVEVVLEPDEPPPPHFHPSQEEQFEVLEGELSARVDGEERTLTQGDTLTVPRGAVHQMWNPSAGRTRALWRTTPRLRTPAWFAALDSLLREGHVGRGGTPSPVALAPYLMEYRDVIRPAVKPRPLVHVALVLLARIGRLRGYRPKA